MFLWNLFSVYFLTNHGVSGLSEKIKTFKVSYTRSLSEYSLLGFCAKANKLEMLFGIENLGNSAAVSVPKYLCVDGLYEFVLCSSNLLQKLYVTMFPCNECAKIILQSGVAEVIYFVEKRPNDSDVAYVASHKLLSMANVKVRKHQPEMDEILIKFEEHLLQPET